MLLSARERGNSRDTHQLAVTESSLSYILHYIVHVKDAEERGNYRTVI